MTTIEHEPALPLVDSAEPLGATVTAHQLFGRPAEVLLDDWQASLPTRPTALTVLLPEARRPRTTVVAVDYAEREHLLAARGRAGTDEVAAELIRRVCAELEPQASPVSTEDGRVLVPVGARTAGEVEAGLQRCVASVHDEPVGAQRVTPAFGWSTAPTLGPKRTPELVEQALDAAQQARQRLDVVPQRFTDEEPTRHLLSHRTRTQVLLTTVAALGWPLLLVGVSAALGVQPADWVYGLVIAALLLTAGSIWLESVLALPKASPPPLTRTPRVSAVIAAYLPNEADTIVETVEAFLRVDYPDAQVLLAYNTPDPLPVEDQLRALAAQHDRLQVVEVPFSTSKAQNVNAALHLADGEVIGIFDADHHPEPDSFTRAAAWIESGADVVQGRCLIRNRDESPMSALIGIEFDALYGVSHLGRARLHGFGVFGGSNGWWRADLLRRLRMRPSMLTEDIDSSIRALLDGAHLRYDPDLVSTELAPTTARAWWSQRARWAQGWVQVSVRHLGACVRSDVLGRRQKIGAALLLGWREVAPWTTLAMLPLVAYSLWWDDEPGIPLNVPALLLSALVTTLAGPFQTWVAYRVTPAAYRGSPWRYVLYGVVSLGYTELKNVVARVAQIKESAGERTWVTTPRTSGAVTTRPTEEAPA